MRTISLNLCQYDELPTDKAKAKARAWFFSVDDWNAEGTKEDAAQVGLELIGWDASGAGRSQLEFSGYPENTAALIVDNHGPHCDTFQAAEAFRAGMAALGEEPAAWCESGRANTDALDAWQDARGNLVDTFKASLEKAYGAMVASDYEDHHSDEYAIDMIEANEYEFTIDGGRYAEVNS